MPRKKKDNPMGDYLPSDDEKLAMRECIDQRIVKISPKGTKSGDAWHIDIWLNNKWNTSPETYGPGEIWEKIYEFYRYYYEKYSK